MSQYPKFSGSVQASDMTVTVNLNPAPTSAVGTQWIVLDSLSANAAWSTAANKAQLTFQGDAGVVWQLNIGNNIATAPAVFSQAWPDGSGPRLKDTGPKVILFNLSGTPIANNAGINVIYHYEQG